MTEQVLAKLFRVVQVFIEKFSFPAEVASFNFCHENLVKAKLDEVEVLKHLSKFEEDIKSLKEEYKAVRIPETRGRIDFVTGQAGKGMKRNSLEDSAVICNEENVIQEVDASLIQVTARKAEIDRRIAAFMQRKQLEVDMLNRREFCNVISTESDPDCSCARTDAVFVHRLGQRSHIKVTRIENTSTTSEIEALGQTSGPVTFLPSRLEKPGPGVEERLCNIETYLGNEPGRPVPVDVYKRLNILEDRILQLESLSPEYFTPTISGSMGGRMRTSVTSSYKDGKGSPQNLSLEAIDERIKVLRHSLSKGLGT